MCLTGTDLYLYMRQYWKNSVVISQEQSYKEKGQAEEEEWEGRGLSKSLIAAAAAPSFDVSTC